MLGAKKTLFRGVVTDQESVRVFYWLPGWMWREGNKNKNTTQASATIRVLFSFSLFKNVILFAKFCLVFCMSCFCVWDIIQILNPTTRPFDKVWQGVSCCLDDSQDAGIWGESHCIGGRALPYLIFVIFFTRAKFLENKIYTEKRQFFALNL